MPPKHRIQKFDSEAKVHQDVADYLKLQYRNVIFHTDFAAGIKLPPWLAIKHSKLQSRRGYPDLTVLEARLGYKALLIELKSPSARIFKMDGSWASPHLAEQEVMLHDLQVRGYAAVFADGFDQARAILDWYLGDGPELNFSDKLMITTADPKPVQDLKLPVENIDIEEHF
jgi:hypothetical protein